MIWSMAGIMASQRSPAVAALAILDSFALVLSSRSDAATFPVSSGANRLLLAAEYSRTAGTSDPVTALAYGGRPMTSIVSRATTSGPDLDSRLWLLDEADLALASGAGFSVTPNTGGVQFRLAAGSLANVDQVDPIVDAFVGDVEDGSNPPSQALTTVTGGIAIAALFANRGTDDAGATEDASYSNMTERVEVAPSRSYLSVATAPTPGTSFTPGTTLVHETAGHLLAAALRPAA